MHRYATTSRFGKDEFQRVTARVELLRRGLIYPVGDAIEFVFDNRPGSNTSAYTLRANGHVFHGLAEAEIGDNLRQGLEITADLGLFSAFEQTVGGKRILYRTMHIVQI